MVQRNVSGGRSNGGCKIGMVSAAAAAALIALSPVASNADSIPGRPYYYEKVVDESVGGFYFFFRPSLDNHGGVVFKAWRTGDPGESLYTGPNPATDTFAVFPSQSFGSLRGYTKNGAGTIGFTAFPPTQPTVAVQPSAFTAPDPSSNLMPTPARSLAGIGSISLNNSNQAAIRATYKNGSLGIRDIAIAANNGQGRILAQAYTSAGAIFDTVINNAGTIVVATNGFNDMPSIGVTSVSETGLATRQPAFAVGGPFISPHRIDLNDHGGFTFASNFVYQHPYAVTGVFYAPDLETATVDDVVIIADERGPFRDFGDIALNNQNTVAFSAHVDGDAGGGIYTGPDPATHKVIAAGDVIFGGSVQDVFFQRDGYNDLGQMAFVYTLTNGGSGVAIATPAIEGDADGNGVVNIADFGRLAANFNGSGIWQQGNFNGNGSVEITDFAMLASNFNQTAGAGRPGAVPEPSTIGLLIFGVLLARKRRARFQSQDVLVPS
jgi:hypothetical protein